MVTLERFRSIVADALSEWDAIRLTDLLYLHRDTAVSAIVLLLGLSIGAVALRAVLSRRPERGRVALPALIDSGHASKFSFVRHIPHLLFLAGLLFFAVAFADPYTSLARQETSFPGRRIALMIDASSSMTTRFPSTHLGVNNDHPATFFTAVGAARMFIEQRINGKYRDLISLIEFGDEAYVVTPFTNDYNNILMSVALIDDWTEFLRFPDQGTTIGKALEEATSLFKAFDFLNAAGNLIIIFSDGQDTQINIQGRSVQEILTGAIQTKIPVYFIRCSYTHGDNGTFPDQIWKPAVESTGGRFYAASDEATILRAIREIDTLSAGKVQIRQYSTERPRFRPFALGAVGLWTLALALKLTVAQFQKFP